MPSITVEISDELAAWIRDSAAYDGEGATVEQKASQYLAAAMEDARAHARIAQQIASMEAEGKDAGTGNLPAAEKGMAVMISVPWHWVDSLPLLPLFPEDEDTIEARILNCVQFELDHQHERLRQQAKDAGATH
jgi:hypothetical protein